MAAKLPTLAELTACPHCGCEEYYVRYQYSGKGVYGRSYNGNNEGVNNSGMYDKLVMTPGKRAYCTDCDKPVAIYSGEHESDS